MSGLDPGPRQALWWPCFHPCSIIRLFTMTIPPTCTNGSSGASPNRSNGVLMWVRERARVFFSRHLWACVRPSHKGPPEEPVGPRLGSSHLKEEAELEAQRRRAVHGGALGRSLLPTAALFPVPKWRRHFGFASCAKFLCFFLALETPAGVAGGGESWCPSLEAAYPGTDTRVCVNAQRQADRKIHGRGATATMPVRQKGTFNHVGFHFSSFCISTKRNADVSFCVWLNPISKPAFDIC